MSACPEEIKPWLWQKGVSANPAGRPKGSRHKLEETFLKDLAKDWEGHGIQAIEAAREKDPVAYVRIVAALLPKKIEQEDPLKDVNREQLRFAVEFLSSIVSAGAVPQIAGSTGQPEQAGTVSAISETDGVPR